MAIMPIAVLIFGWDHVSSFIGVSVGKQADAESKTIKVMTYNLSFFNQFVIKKKNGDQLESDFYSFIQEEDSDIICFQEFPRSGVLHRKMVDQIKKKCGMKHFYQNSTNSLAFFSKYPISSHGTLPFGNASNGCSYIETNIKNKPIRVYNIHLQSNSVSGIANNIATTGEIDDKKTWNAIRKMLGIVKKNAPKRSEQAKIISKHLLNCRYPSIVCGDFNETPMSFSYQLLKINKLDAFQEAGFGIGTTYTGKIPALKIDHILVSNHFTPLKCNVLRESFSDHYPVTSTLEFN